MNDFCLICVRAPITPQNPFCFSSVAFSAVTKSGPQPCCVSAANRGAGVGLPGHVSGWWPHLSVRMQKKLKHARLKTRFACQVVGRQSILKAIATMWKSSCMFRIRPKISPDHLKHPSRLIRHYLLLTEISSSCWGYFLELYYRHMDGLFTSIISSIFFLFLVELKRLRSGCWNQRVQQCQFSRRALMWRSAITIKVD